MDALPGMRDQARGAQAVTLWDDLDKAYAEVESLLGELPPGNAREVVRMLVGQLRGCAKRLRLLSQASREHLEVRAQELEETRAEAIEECAKVAEDCDAAAPTPEWQACQRSIADAIRRRGKR